MTTGARLFARYAQPPNSLGYCGPEENVLRDSLPLAGEEAEHAIIGAAGHFDGAWPYLQLIGERTRRDPLAADVVAAYWLGGDLLGRVGANDWGNSLRDRFRPRAGDSWQRIAAAVNEGGVPHHSFHVYCVYPWIGLLKQGIVEPSLRVLDRCRIRVGQVVEEGVDRSLVAYHPLEWDGQSVRYGAENSEWTANPLDVHAPRPRLGDVVALHWDEICGVVSRTASRRIQRLDRQHLDIANRLGLEPP